MSHARRRAAWAVLAASIPYAAYALATDRAGAARRADADFEAACAWIARQGAPAGPVLARHPGDVFIRTGRAALAPPDDPGAIGATIRRYGVAFLLVDDARFAGASASPLGRFADGRVRRAWKQGAVAVYEVPPAGDSPRRADEP